MTESKNHTIGILAFGSLIDNTGQEISEIEIDRLDCETPFAIEFARTSVRRKVVKSRNCTERWKFQTRLAVIQKQTNK